MTKQTIVPHLWFNKEVNEAVAFYTSIFPQSTLKHVITLHDTPSGDAEIVSFELWGQEFMAINGGPYFKFNPSISFFVYFNPSKEKDASETLEEVWNRLAEGGFALMPLGQYPFSEKFGWIQDKYGVSWQLMLTNPESEERAKIVPSLLFVRDQYGKVEEAIRFYLSVFKNAKEGNITRYPQGMEPDKEGAVMSLDFMLENYWFSAMESAHNHQFSFNEAISFIVYCDTQEEIDYYWEKLSAVPEVEQCGWLKDQYGISWQVVPREMNEIMATSTPEQIDKINKEILKMKKIDVTVLQEINKG